MSQSTKSPAAWRLQAIPLELSTYIAQFLDRQSALALSRTCEALRPAAEVKLYERVNLTASVDGEPRQKGQYFTRADFLRRSPIVEAKLRAILSALASCPARAGYIRQLRIEPYDLVADPLVEVIKKVAQGVQRLDILPFPTLPAWSNAEGPQPTTEDIAQFVTNWGRSPDKRANLIPGLFYILLNSAKLPFPQLTHLKLGYLESPSVPVVDTWMTLMSNISTLEISSAYGTYELPLTPQPVHTQFQHLHTLTFCNLYDGHAHYGLDILATLLELAPNLETLRLRGKWRPNSGQRAVQTLRNLHGLKTVVMESERLYCAHERTVELKGSSIVEVAWAVEEMTVEVPTRDESAEIHIEDLPIPNAPSLRQIAMLTSPRLSLSGYASLALGKSSPEPAPIPELFLDHLRRTPDLTTIPFVYHPAYIPSAYDSDFTEPELFAEPCRWAAEGYRGLIIRQYHDQASADNLWHLRRLSRAARTANGTKYLRDRRVWNHLTDFKGRVVPCEIMDKVYEALGESSDFLDGGRNLSLGSRGDVAWDILRKWRCDLGDKEESMAGKKSYRDLMHESTDTKWVNEQ